METQVKQNILERVVEAVKDILNPQPDSAFTVQKDLNGNWRWMATFTNNFKDRDGEIISEKALDGYLERVSLGLVPMPELWVGHVKGTRHGVADMVFAVGNFVTATGTFDDTPEAQKAIEFYRKGTKDIALSHGFTYPAWGLKNGIYEVINTFEVSTLPPPMVASNPFTEFEVESMKQYTPEQKAAVAKTYGQDFSDKFFTSLEKQSEDIKAAGTAFKDFAQVKDETPETEAEKPMGELIAALMESQGELLTLLGAQGKAIKAFEAERTAEKVIRDTEKAAQDKKVAELESTVKTLQAELKLTPRASEAAETKLSDKEAEAVKKQIDQAEADPFFS